MKTQSFWQSVLIDKQAPNIITKLAGDSTDLNVRFESFSQNLIGLDNSQEAKDGLPYQQNITEKHYDPTTTQAKKTPSLQLTHSYYKAAVDSKSKINNTSSFQPLLTSTELDKTSITLVTASHSSKNKISIKLTDATYLSSSVTTRSIAPSDRLSAVDSTTSRSSKNYELFDRKEQTVHSSISHLPGPHQEDPPSKGSNMAATTTGMLNGVDENQLKEHSSITISQISINLEPHRIHNINKLKHSSSALPPTIIKPTVDPNKPFSAIAATPDMIFSSATQPTEMLTAHTSYIDNNNHRPTFDFVLSEKAPISKLSAQSYTETPLLRPTAAVAAHQSRSSTRLKNEAIDLSELKPTIEQVTSIKTRHSDAQQPLLTTVSPDHAHQVISSTAFKNEAIDLSELKPTIEQVTSIKTRHSDAQQPLLTTVSPDHAHQVISSTAFKNEAIDLSELKPTIEQVATADRSSATSKQYLTVSTYPSGTSLSLKSNATAGHQTDIERLLLKPIFSASIPRSEHLKASVILTNNLADIEQTVLPQETTIRSSDIFQQLKTTPITLVKAANSITAQTLQMNNAMQIQTPTSAPSSPLAILSAIPSIQTAATPIESRMLNKTEPVQDRYDTQNASTKLKISAGELAPQPISRPLALTAKFIPKTHLHLEFEDYQASKSSFISSTAPDSKTTNNSEKANHNKSSPLTAIIDTSSYLSTTTKFVKNNAESSFNIKNTTANHIPEIQINATLKPSYEPPTSLHTTFSIPQSGNDSILQTVDKVATVLDANSSQFRENLQRIIEQHSTLLAKNTKELTIELLPRELGKIELNLKGDVDRMTLQVTANNSSIRDWFNSNFDRIRDGINHQGMEFEMNFSQQKQSHKQPKADHSNSTAENANEDISVPHHDAHDEIARA